MIRYVQVVNLFSVDKASFAWTTLYKYIIYIDTFIFSTNLIVPITNATRLD